MEALWTSNLWVNETNRYFARYRRGTKVFLSQSDWDDIEQKLLHHIWKKRALYNDTMAFKPWLKTVVHNFVYNQIRNLISTPNKPIDRAAKLNLMYPERIDSVRLMISNFGEVIEYVPAIIDPTYEVKEPTAEEFYTVLNDLEQKVLACALDQKTVIETAQVVNRKPSYVYEIKQNIRKKYKAFL